MVFLFIKDCFAGVNSPGGFFSYFNYISDDIKEKIRDYSARLAECVGLRHLARLDYFLSTDGKIYFNEINTFPGMTEASLYSRLAENAGYPIGELLLSFLSEAEQ